MRARIVAIVIILLVPYLYDLPSSTINSAVEAFELDATGGEAGNSLRLQEVCPGEPVEFITLVNPGPSPVDLNGTSLSDREGSLIFRTELPLGAGVRMILTPDALVCATYLPGQVLDYSAAGIERKGRFALADEGDQVLLLSPNGTCQDILIYGSAAVCPPWSGHAFDRIPSGESARRVIEADPTAPFQASTWSKWVPGRTELLPWKGTGEAECLVYPDQALAQITSTLQNATSSIHLCVYDLDHPLLLDCLVAARERGAEVQVLLEGQPVTGLSSSSSKAITRLVDAGVDVRLGLSCNSYQRYDYLHCKYAVVDRNIVILGSENWNQDAFRSNRGWGLLVQSEGLAGYLFALFHQDLDGRYGDVVARGEMAQNDSREGNRTIGPAESGHAMEAWASPDHSLPSMLSLLRSAQQRILIQCLDCDLTWMKASGLWAELQAAAARGVTVRMLLDASFNDTREDNARVVQAASTWEGQGPGMAVRLVSQYHEFRSLHNKGMVVDQVAMISSINLVRSAFQDNRELALTTTDPSVVARLASLFWHDWEIDPVPPSIEGIPRQVTCLEGEPALLDASGCHDAAGIDSLTWDLDGDDVSDASGARITFTAATGQHLVLLTVRDGNGNSATQAIVVQVFPQEGESALPLLPLALAVAIVLSSLLWLRRKRIKRG